MVANSYLLLRSSTRRGPWCLADSYNFIAYFISRSKPRNCHTPGSIQERPRTCSVSTQRHFHNYFLTNLPSPSVRNPHNISQSSSLPHTSAAKSLCQAPASTPRVTRELTAVRIPIQSAKQHFGACQSRGTRPSIEDTFQAGTIDIPAFAKTVPPSVDFGYKSTNGVDNSSTDPQVFCFGIFDGHGGNECSDFLREKLHDYVERTAGLFGIESSLRQAKSESDPQVQNNSKLCLKNLANAHSKENVENLNISNHMKDGNSPDVESYTGKSMLKETCDNIKDNTISEKVIWLEKSLVREWKETVGGYFRRFKPEYFNLPSDIPVSMESVLMYAFLKADLDFVSAQAHKPEIMKNRERSVSVNQINEPINFSIQTERIGGPNRFFGGSTASIALISTPNSIPFWHPASSSTILVAHVGDTRIILCETATGLAKPCTSNHYPSTPSESNRLRRYSTTFTTDSFGEERIFGLANTRSFGDMHSKRIGVSAEPEINRIELVPAEYSMLVLVSDGVSGVLSDQEIVDVIKEAKTPAQGARDVVSLASEVSKNGDNATCLVVRLGGWEKREEGGLGSLGTKEGRDWRRGDASDMRKVECHR